MLETDRSYPLEPAVGWLAAGRRLLFWCFLGAGALALAGQEDSATGQWLAAHRSWLYGAVPLLVLFIVVPIADYRTWRWQLRQHDFLLIHGLIVRRTVALPLSRIQQVDSHSGVLERALGMTRLTLHSAGSRAARVDLPGIAKDLAGELQQRLSRASDELGRD